jgi:hypothetical protein
VKGKRETTQDGKKRNNKKELGEKKREHVALY